MVDFDALVVGPCVDVFGETVSYRSLQGLAFDVTGVFDEAYRELKPISSGAFGVEGFDLGSPGSITTEMPVLGVQLSQFPPDRQPAQGDSLLIRGQPYVVKNVQPDSHGHALLLLNEGAFLS